LTIEVADKVREQIAPDAEGMDLPSARRNNVTMPEFIEDYWAPRRNIAP